MDDARSGDPAVAPTATEVPPRWCWQFGALFGVKIYIHATFLLLVAWIAISYAARARDPLAAIDGIAVLLSMFGMVVLHELGHAVAARRFGIATRSIMLLPIGGVSSLERMPDRPHQTLLVAAAGPAVNLAIALWLAAMLAATGASLAPAAVTADAPLLARLLWINVTLAVFNLLPAYPMDGGRLLQALLALAIGRERATLAAARVGKAMAILFGILGALGNPVLLLIALFVWLGADQESSLARLRIAVGGLPARRAMITAFATLAPADTLRRASELARTGFQRDFPVVEDGRAVGLLTHAVLLRELGARGDGARVGDVMRGDLETVPPDRPLDDLLVRILSRPEQPIVVEANGHAVGLLTADAVGELVAQLAPRARTAHGDRAHVARRAPPA
jgi:Zn-dependent protease/CBS domain-containing protein